MLGKELLKNVGMSAYERYCVYNEIDNVVNDREDLDNYFIHTFILLNNEITFCYDRNGECLEDVDRDECIEIIEVVKYDVEELLTENNISFEKSSISESVYFEHNTKEYRISTHKRPAYEDASGLYHDHEYNNEIICENEIEMYQIIKNILN